MPMVAPPLQASMQGINCKGFNIMTRPMHLQTRRREEVSKF